MTKINTTTRLWNRSFIVVSSVNFLMMLNYYMLLVTIGTYVVEHFDASKSMAGLVTGIMVIGCLLGRFVTGYLIELIGCRKILFVGTVLFIITMSLYFLAVNLPLLIFIRFISGITVGIVGTVTGTIAVYVIPLARRGEGISYFSMSTILATAMGPFVGLFLMQYVTFSLLFLLGVIIGFITLVLILVAKMEKIEITKSASNSHWWQLSNFIEPKAISISSVLMLASIGFAGIQTYLSFYTKEMDLLSVAKLFFIVYALVILISRPFSGKILDSKGENIVAYPALIFQTLGFILLSQANSTFTLLFSAVLIGFGFGNFQSIIQTVAIKISPKHKVGQATSTFFILYDFGLGLGPYFLGFLIPLIGYRGIYLFAAGLSFFCIFLYYFLHGRKVKPQQVEIIDET